MVSGMFTIWDEVGKIAAIAKKQLFYVFPFGLTAYLAGVVFIDRNNPKAAYKQLKETSELMVHYKVCTNKPIPTAYAVRIRTQLIFIYLPS